jgi:DNA processing protein
LDKIYPVENSSLAQRIETQSGVLVSELALGATTSKKAFVQRDRIQSGLSVAVFAIQTDVIGGTMHTVRFAEKYGRLMFCPEPSEAEAWAKQNSGILHLIKSKRAHAFRDDYETVFKMLKRARQEDLNLSLRKSRNLFAGDAQVTDQQLDRFI